MKKNIYVAVSTDPLSSYQDIIEYAKSIQYVADFLHCDVMDGDFVKKVTYDYSLIKNINANTAIPLDVHLMVSEPFKDIKRYAESGANIITVHYEAFSDKNMLTDAISLIKSCGALAGISLKPETPFKDIKAFCFNVDLVLIMSVDPGASGQKFITEISKKIKEVDDFRKNNELKFKIEVDGGVSPENSKELIDLGVDVLVSGSYVYKAPNKEAAILELKEVK